MLYVLGCQNKTPLGLLRLTSRINFNNNIILLLITVNPVVRLCLWLRVYVYNHYYTDKWYLISALNENGMTADD